MRFRMYYHFASTGEHLSVENATDQDNLDGLMELLDRLRTDEDGVYVYLPEQRERLEFYLLGSSVVSEFHDSSTARIYSRRLTRDRLGEMPSLISALVDDHELSGFDVQPW